MEHLKAYEKTDGSSRMKFWQSVRETLPESTEQMLIDLERQTGHIFGVEEERCEGRFRNGRYPNHEDARQFKKKFAALKPDVIKIIAKEFKCPEDYLIEALEDYEYENMGTMRFHDVPMTLEYKIPDPWINPTAFVVVYEFAGIANDRIRFVTLDNYIKTNDQ